MTEQVLWFKDLGMGDVERVGGKNAALGEMITNLSATGVRVPDGFATTADAYRTFITHEGLDQRIHATLDALDVENLAELARVGSEIRGWIASAPFPSALKDAVATAWQSLGGAEDPQIALAVRSSATAEDLPDASFAGQQETYLNVCGLDSVMAAIQDVFASLFNDRAIAYRVHQGFEHKLVALSAGIQRMVRSDLGASGVLFTLDTESGFDNVVLITASYGLGETVVQGSVNPDEFYAYKPNVRAGKPAIVRRNIGSKSLRMVFAEPSSHDTTTRIEDVPAEDQIRFCISDEDIHTLAEYALIIEDHYQRPMDIEWGKDGVDGKIYILQARPETVKSRSGGIIERYKLSDRGNVIVEGRSIGQRIGSGTARILSGIEEMERVQPGDVLVTDITDPDWEPIMKRASAIVTNRGGRTCHAAIIAREMGIPAVVGTGDATTRIQDGMALTVSCAEGDTGFVYDSVIDFEVSQIELDNMPECPVKITMNVGNPDRAFEFAGIPNCGVGLARLEFIINRMIGVHPKALLEFDSQPERERKQITRRMAGYASPQEFYIAKITEGVATIAAAFAPEPVIVRLSDFKSNEYRALIGGDRYEPEEENPMLGFRGASRYLDASFADCFAMECAAMRRVREDMGFTNVWLMVPFVRTVSEAQAVVELMREHGLERGKNDLKLMMMCELPSNAILADEFLEYFDGFSIGSNDLTQLTLGLDRDSGLIAKLFDERDPAVKALIGQAIAACRKAGKYVGICGQGPSDHPDLAEWLMDQGIESLSLNPDTVMQTWLYLSGEQR